MEADLSSDENEYDDEACFFGVKPAKVPVDKMRELPHSLIGVITMDIEGSSDPGVGTGILISPDLVLTAAHNLWNKGKACDNFRFYLAHNGLLGQSYFKVKSCYFPDEFTQKNVPTHDYAILRLAEKTNVKEFIDLKGDLQSVDQIHEIAIYGYPAQDRIYNSLRDRYSFELHQCGLIREKNLIENIDREKGRIYHKISTVEGQSGAPILLIDKMGKMTIIGIHKGGVNKGSINVGRLLTQELIEKLKKQAVKLGAQTFIRPENNSQKKSDIGQRTVGGISKSMTITLFQAGQVLLKHKKWKEADQCFQQVLSEEPGHVQALCQRAQSLLEMGKNKEALEICKKELQIDANNATTHSYLGRAQRKLGKCEEALASCRRALTIDPSHADAHFNMGSALYSLGRREEAMEWYRKAIALDPSHANAHNGMGVVLSSLGRKKEAIEWYKKAIAIDPSHTDAHCSMGNVLDDLGRKEEAMEWYRKAIALNPNEVNAHCSMGSVLDDLGRKEQALEWYRKAIALNPNEANTHNDIGVVLYDLKRKEEAVEWYRKAIALNPSHANAHFNMGVALNDLRRKEEAQKEICRAIELNPCKQLYYKNLISLLSSSARRGEGVSFLERVVFAYPDCRPAAEALQLLRKQWL